jgi:hypothetical protein
VRLFSEDVQQGLLAWETMVTHEYIELYIIFPLLLHD